MVCLCLRPQHGSLSAQCVVLDKVKAFIFANHRKCFFGTRDLFNISYSRELYLFSKFLHFEEIVRAKMAVCFEMIESET